MTMIAIAKWYHCSNNSRLGDFWREYSAEDMLAMLKVLTDIHISSGNDFTRRAMPVISSWILHNIHTLTEDQLLAIVYCYTKMEYVDNEFVSSLQKYVKVRCDIDTFQAIFLKIIKKY